MSVDFIDSNVFLYLFDRTATEKAKIANQIVSVALDTGSAVTSFQVLQEVLNVLTRTRERPDPRDLQQLLDAVLFPLCRVMPSQTLYQRALDIRTRFLYSFYDSLIIAAALQAGANQLLSEDLHNGQRIEGLTIVNPFRR